MLTQGSAATLVAAGLLAVVDWVAVARAAAGLERLAKPAVVAALVATVLLNGPGAEPRTWLLVGALLASLAGDVLLLPPGRFTAGLAAFLVAHLAYLGIFLFDVGWLPGAAFGAAGTLVLLATAGRMILAGAAASGAAIPVAAYLVAISAMAIAASASGSAIAALGAWLFVASDTLLGWDRFAGPAPATPAAAARRRVAIMVSYHTAQIALTVAILGLVAA
jgi:uncharacterized membrane protein YhhN